MKASNPPTAAKLADDYSANYYDQPIDPRMISGYGEIAQQKKDQFHRDGLRYLRTLGKALGQYGFDVLHLASNKAGIAVSGDVYAQFWADTHGKGIKLCLSECLGEDRPDHVSLRANELRNRKLPVKRERRDRFDEGPNVWFSANLDSDVLAQKLLPLLQISTSDPRPTLRSLFDQAEHHPELDIVIRDRYPASQRLRITVTGDPAFAQPQIERLVDGLPNTVPQRIQDGLQVLGRVHPQTVLDIHRRAEIQNNTRRQRGELPNVALWMDERPIYMGPVHTLDLPLAANDAAKSDVALALDQLLAA